MISGSLVLKFGEAMVWCYFQLNNNSWNLASLHDCNRMILQQLPETGHKNSNIGQTYMHLAQCLRSLIYSRDLRKEHKKKEQAWSKASPQ